MNLQQDPIRNLLVGAADVSRYTGGYTSADETRFLGENLDYQMGRMVGVRSLNVHNSLLLARYTKMYPIVVRLHNADDVVQFTHNYDWTTPAQNNLSYGYDAFWGVSGINPGDTLNFRVYNAFVGGYAYGYSIFQYNNFWAQSFAGVSGIAGAELNASKPVGYYGGFNFTY